MLHIITIQLSSFGCFRKGKKIPLFPPKNKQNKTTTKTTNNTKQTRANLLREKKTFLENRKEYGPTAGKEEDRKTKKED